MINQLSVVFWISLSLALSIANTQRADAQWQRHTIDDVGKGADGVRLLDVDGDGLEDIVTGWEQSGHVCVYFQPSTTEIRKPWPRVAVGKIAAVEDAVAIDVDSDGIAEVISCHEGGEKSVVVHRYQGNEKKPRRADLLNSENWKSAVIQSCHKQSRWMFATALKRHDGHLRAIAVASKDPNGQVSLLMPTKNRSTTTEPIENWRRIKLQTAGWIMSLVAIDMDGDGDEDIVVSDRKGPRRGVYWLQSPGEDRYDEGSAWTRHDVSGENLSGENLSGKNFSGKNFSGENFEVMFLDAAADRVLVATRNSVTLDFTGDGNGRWQRSEHTNPAGILAGKAVRWLDQAKTRYVFSANTGVGKGDKKKSGVWIASTDANEKPIDVSGVAGVKYDRIEVRDLDRDGDLDVITCEERDNLGVFWYENPDR